MMTKIYRDLTNLEEALLELLDRALEVRNWALVDHLLVVDILDHLDSEDTVEGRSLFQQHFHINLKFYYSTHFLSTYLVHIVLDLDQDDDKEEFDTAVADLEGGSWDSGDILDKVADFVEDILNEIKKLINFEK